MLYTYYDFSQKSRRSKRGSSGDILGIRQMRRQDNVAVDADVVVGVAVGLHIGRVDIADGGAVVYSFQLVTCVRFLCFSLGGGKGHTWVAEQHNLADPRGRVGVELANGIVHNLASL